MFSSLLSKIESNTRTRFFLYLTQGRIKKRGGRTLNFSRDSQPNLDIIEAMLLVLLESLQTNLADLRCTASNVCESHTEAQYSNLGLTKV